jgi:hypothetical protein
MTKETALKRAKQMGKGCELTEFSLHTASDGGLETTATYTITDVNNIRFTAPFLGKYGHTKGHLRVTIQPCYTQRWASPDRPGWMVAVFSEHDFAKPPKKPKAKKGEKKPEITPAQMQKVRELIPVFAELFKGFRLRLTFESYNPLLGGNYKYPGWETIPGSSVPSKKKILLDISDSNINRFGQNILENEEIVMAILENKMFASPIRKLFADETNQWNGFYDLMKKRPGYPFIFYNGLSWTDCRRAFEPSDYHYKRYFDGKPKQYGGNK